MKIILIGTTEYVRITPDHVNRFVYGAISCSAMGIFKERPRLTNLIHAERRRKKLKRHSIWLWFNYFLSMALRCMIFHIGHKNFRDKSNSCIEMKSSAQIYSEWKERVELDSKISLEAFFKAPICAMDPEERKKYMFHFQ